MTIGELEKLAGITDRTAFWMPFVKITGSIKKNGKLVDKGLEDGIAELHRIINEKSFKEAA